MPDKKKQYFKYFGLLLFFYILSKIDYRELFLIFLSVKALYFIPALLISFGVIFLTGLRWQYILQKVDVKISLTSSIYLWLKGAYLDFFIPGKIGSLFKAKYLSDHSSISLGKASFSVYLERIFDLITLVLFAIIGVTILLVFYSFGFPNHFVYPTLIILLISLSLCISKKFMIRMINIQKRIFYRIFPEKKKPKLDSYFTDFMDSFRSMEKNTLKMIMLYSLINWFLSILRVYLLASSLTLNAPFMLIFALVPIAVLISALPISIMGFGTRDAVYIVVLAIANIPKESSIALSFLTVIFANLILLLPGLLAHWKQEV